MAKRPNNPAVLSVVLGHRWMVGGEMECVEELGKVERNEDRVHTTTFATRHHARE